METSYLPLINFCNLKFPTFTGIDLAAAQRADISGSDRRLLAGM
jgi:hypothetical protein